MAESKLAKLRHIKSHPLAFYPTKKHSNKVNVTIHPKVILGKKHKQRLRQRASTILDVSSCDGISPGPEKIRIRNSNFLEVHFICSRAVGAAPYQFDKSIKWQLRGTYFLVNSFAMLDNFLMVWESIQDAINVSSTTEIATYVKIAKQITTVALRSVHVTSLWNDAEKYESIFTTLDGTSYSGGIRNPQNAAAAVGLSVFGMIRAVSRSLAGITSGIEFLLVGNCARIITKFVPNWNEPENIDFATGTLGVVGFLATLAGGIIQQAALTGPLMATATLLSACKQFKYKKETTPPGLETGTANVNGGVPQGLHYIGKRYAELKKISKSINRAFSPVLKLTLLANLLMFASLIDNIFNGNIGKGRRAWMLFDAALACVFLYLANAVGNTGGRFREWLKVDQNRIKVGMSQLDVMQEELSPNAIGIGREAFFIKDGFLLGYIGAIVAYFFGIVETRAGPGTKAVLLQCGQGNMNQTVN